MKKRISILLVLAMICGILPVCGYASQIDERDRAKAFIEAAYAANPYTMSDEDEKSILGEFSREISYVEDKYNITIINLNKETMEFLTSEAVVNYYNESYRFVDLIDRISMAYAEYCFSEEGLKKVRSGPNDPVVVIEEYLSYRALRGTKPEYAPIGTSVSKTETVTINSGSDCQGVTLGSSVSKSVSYTVNGPNNGDTLNNGKAATHRMVFSVLYGRIIKHTVTYPQGGTHVFYYVDQSSTNGAFHTALARLESSTFYANGRNGTVRIYTTLNSLDNDAINSPAAFV